MSLLEIQNLSYYYAGEPLIRNFSLSVSKGQIISLLGENGAGKSTIIKLIAGLLDKNSGIINYKGEAIKGPSEQLIPGHPQIKTIFQDYRLAHKTTVYSNIYSLLPPLKEALKIAKTEQTLYDFRLDSLAHKKVEELSGGEKQRVAIARAVVNDPDILLMDEPFSNLDAHNKNTITSLVFNYIRSREISALFVTHDYRDALKYSDQLCIIRNGELIQQGYPEDVYYCPATIYSAALLGPVNQIRNRGTQDHTEQYVFIRPEKISIMKEGTLEGTITQCGFAGIHFEVSIAFEQEILHAYHHESLSPGQKIRFSIAW